MKIVFSVLCILFGALSTAYLYFVDSSAALYEAAAFGLLLILGLIIFAFKTASLRKSVKRAEKYFDNPDEAGKRPFPTLLLNAKGEILWYNESFGKNVLGNEIVKSGHYSEFIKDVTLDTLVITENGTSVNYGGKKYTVYAENIGEDKASFVLYFVDYTELKTLADEYKLTRPVVLQMKIDNLEEVYQNYKSSECEVISGELEQIFEKWASRYPSVFRKIGSGKFVMVMEERGLYSVIDSKFEILKEIREYKFGDNSIEITLSIGVGRGGTYFQCDDFAKQALEMSQSRGGDQATINDNGELTFFGGTVQGATKRNKIKARLIAEAFADHVANSDCVFVMGHCFSDLDSVGSSIGIYEAAKALSKECYIICDKEKSMAKHLIEQLEQSTMKGAFIDDVKTEDFLSRRSLLVVVDTHREASLEYPRLLELFEKVIVIDHHRRTANYIQNTVLYYDEPNASSACEMITEIIQYIPAKVALSPAAAEALLSGIMLDTKNFVLSTGSRTFEAAAYLKGIGADTVSVKQLFANTFENHKLKNSIISTAVTYKHCAVAVATEHDKDLRIVASQAADELLGVLGVKASFVLFEDGGQINISARSLGEMNVQLVMETLGGGGHLTMAATQLSGITMGDAVVKLEDAINNYLEENKNESNT